MLSSRQGRRRTGLRLALGVAVAAIATAAFSGTASADPVTGTYAGFADGTGSKASVQFSGQSKAKTLQTGLIRLRTSDGSTLNTYCIDIKTEVDSKARYSERGWDQTIGDNAKYINWILHHSYPTLSVDQVKSTYGLNSGLRERDVVAATQAAIWHYSDGITLKSYPGGDATAAKDVMALYTKLTDSSVNKGEGNEPAPTLKLNAGNSTGHAGEPIGPITVQTSADSVQVALDKDAPQGTKLLGPDKKTEVSTAKNGDQLWVEAPANADKGSASVLAKATAAVNPGRVFVGDKPTQKLILASSKPVAVQDMTKVSWAPQQIPAFNVTSENKCAPNKGVSVTITNTGSVPGEVNVSNGSHSEKVQVPAGASKEVLVPVEESGKYSISVTAPGYSKTVTGTLNCSSPSPSAPAASPTASGQGGGLPVTGTSLPIIVGAGLVLLAAGAGLVLLLRKRRLNAGS